MTEPVCTCNDEFATAPCPVHHPVTEESQPETYGQGEVTTLTDENLAPEVYGTFEGFKFICPDCGVPSVMVNPTMGTFCTKCGRKFIIHSKTVTDFVRKMEAGQ